MKMNKNANKGFSLVELIIVIAIMVILVAVLAPQYMRFVEKSRFSNDKTMIYEVKTAIDTALAEEKIYTQLPPAGFTVTFNKGKAYEMETGKAPADLVTDVKATIKDQAKTALTSKTCGNLAANSVKILVNGDGTTNVWMPEKAEATACTGPQSAPASSAPEVTVSPES